MHGHTNIKFIKWRLSRRRSRASSRDSWLNCKYTCVSRTIYFYYHQGNWNWTREQIWFSKRWFTAVQLSRSLLARLKTCPLACMTGLFPLLPFPVLGYRLSIGYSGESERLGRLPRGFLTGFDFRVRDSSSWFHLINYRVLSLAGAGAGGSISSYFLREGYADVRDMFCGKSLVSVFVFWNWSFGYVWCCSPASA